MNTDTALQVLAAALFVAGVLAFGLATAPLEGIGINADDAFAFGVVFTSVGFVMFADLRRRAGRNGESA